MMVGEMRDPESLAIGIQAALTGHLVLSTLHTNNAVETIGRMVDMGAESYLVAGVCVGILAQRLIRLNCQKCSKPYKPEAEEIKLLSLTTEDLERGRIMKGTGCPECRGTGLRGRVGVFEIVTGTQNFKHAIASNLSFRDLTKVAQEDGYSTMLEDGRMKVLNGWTTPDEIIRAVYTQAVV